MGVPRCGFHRSNFSGLPGYTLKAEPARGNHSGTVYGTGEVQQNLHQDIVSPHGDVQSTGFDFIPFPQDAQNDQSSRSNNFSGPVQNLWSTEMSQTQTESKPMVRFPSQNSIGAHSHKSTNSQDHGRSVTTFSNVSQMEIKMPSASQDMIRRSQSPDSSAVYTPTQSDMQTFDCVQYPGDDYSLGQPSFHRNSVSSLMSQPVSLAAGPFELFGGSGDEAFATTADDDLATTDSVIYNPSAIIETSNMWEDAGFLESQRSSPFLEDWSTFPRMITSTNNSPLEYSPSLEGLSPRYVEDFPDVVELPPYKSTDRVTRKPVGPRPSKVASDLAAASRRPRVLGSEKSDESYKFMGRPSLELDNTAREHPLYHNVSPQADGLYHCPWEKEPGSNCQHKPEKLKCNYDKFVDSHLKPYRCKVSACKDLHFSSTACLLRHEREAHAMHGHGDKPFLCTYEGCERGVAGNGFPRHWNLRDHMRRVHNGPRQPKSSTSGNSAPSTAPAKGRKRKAGDFPEIQSTPKRVTTPPAALSQPREPGLIERYHEKQKLLMETVKQLQDPKHVDNMMLLRSANDCIKVMVQTTQRISSAPAVSIKQSG